MFGHRYFGGAYYGPRYWGDGDNTVAPPVFSGTIPDISVVESTGSHVYQLGSYFTGATSFSIAPAVEAGWSFDTGTGEFSIDTDDVAVFGPYVVTGTNAGGSDDSNGFTVTVMAAPAQAASPSGGWLFLGSYEDQLAKRRERERKRRELERETDEIQDELDRAIAQELRHQEALDAKRDDLDSLARLAKQSADLEAARQYSEKVAEAYARALVDGTRASIEALDQELQRAREEEEALLLVMMQVLE